MSSAACFKGEIPLQVGLNKIVFSFDGAEDYVLEVKRNEPEDKSTDIAKARATAEEEFEASRWARQNKDMYRYYRNLFFAYGTCIDVAEDYVEIGLYDSARERLDYVLKGLPSEAAVKQDAADLGHLVDGEKADANKILTEVAFFTHNPELLKKATLTWLPLYRKSTEKNLPDIGTWYYEQQAEEYAKQINRYIVIGGSSGGVSELLAKYAECRRKTGFYDPKYDLHDFKYPGGPGE